MIWYIYCITNKINKKSYVGQTVDINERWKNHVRNAKHENLSYLKKKFAIQNAILKYGKDAFEWQIIDQFNTLEEANEAEEFYIAYLQTLTPNGYNILRGGNNRQCREETKKKISETLKITGSFVGKKGSLHPNYGTHLSEERKQKQSIALSSDNGPNKKITSIIAKQIYLEYLNNQNISAQDLATKYGLGKSTICNILHKKSWKKVLKDLPDLTIRQRWTPKTY